MGIISAPPAAGRNLSPLTMPPCRRRRLRPPRPRRLQHAPLPLHAVDPSFLSSAANSAASNSTDLSSGMASSAAAAAAAAVAAAAASGPLDSLASAVGGANSAGGGVLSSLASSASSSATLVASAALACFSVGLNLYGGLLTERKRADLQLELERERAATAAAAELQSLLARYRGPLLESAIDLEQRLWHLACFPEEWELAPCAVAACDVTQVVGSSDGGGGGGGALGNGNGVATSGAGVVVPAEAAAAAKAAATIASPPLPAVTRGYSNSNSFAYNGSAGCDPTAALCADEVNYAAFCLAQFLGFVEVVRREGPRERSFLQRGGGVAGSVASADGGDGGGEDGSDVLATFVEGVRFVLCASGEALTFWGATPEVEREHPGSRLRRRRRLQADKGTHYLDSDSEEALAERSLDEVRIRGAALSSPSRSGGSEGGEGEGRDGGGSDDEDETATALRRGRRRSSSSPSRSSSSSSSSLSSSFPVGAASPLPPSTPADIEDLYILRISRGAQRAIGSYMISTPMGASRHYTLSFGKRKEERERERELEERVKSGEEENKKRITSFFPPQSSSKTISGEFCARLAHDAPFTARLAPLRADVAALASGPRWNGNRPFPTSRWTRLLLLQQLLVEAMDLLDPDGARVPVSRRTPLAGVKFAPLIPASKSSAYSHKLASLMQQRSALLGGGGASALAEKNEAVKAVLEAMASAAASPSAPSGNNNPFARLMMSRGKDGKP